MVSDSDRLKYASDQFYLKSADEMAALFPEDRAALDNTLAIAERCNLEIKTGQYHLPEFAVPAGYTLDSYFEQVARQGFEERLAALKARAGGRGLAFPEEIYRERLALELEVIRKMGFPGYFLVVWDFIRFSRENQIPVGPGRGSAAGSLVSYALRITDVDPLAYGLLFERFLNPERISMPDIDIDFCMRRRGEVIQYVKEKYGRDRVAQIITFGTLAAKAVIRDVGRVLGLPYAKADRVAKLLPDMTRSLAEAAKEVDSLAAEVANDPEIKQVIEVGLRLEGLSRNAGMHAAGVVIAPRAIDELVPLCKTNNDEVITQWDMTVIEKLGLLKMDFLGLRTLTVIDDTLKILARQGTALDLDAVSLDDPEVYRLFYEGRTNGIFQFESSGMKDLLRRAHPTRFEDLAAFNALYRPGALTAGMVEQFIRRKLGQTKVAYILPETEPILAETYGVIVYQEQVMQIAVAIAGFSMGEADVLRKAMGKKQSEVMAEQRAKFVDGAAARGFPRRKVEDLWEYIEPFAGYGFNKSHSVAYALLAYKTAYLKTHYPVAFMAAMLSSEMDSTDDFVKHVQECREMAIAVLPPDVNESDWWFGAVGTSIRFGLGAIKGLGESAAEAILEARRRVGRFRSLVHLASEVEGKQVNQKVFECLIKSGACDGFGVSRGEMAAALERVLDYAQRRRREREEGQVSLFGGGAETELRLGNGSDPWGEQERLRFEKEALGLYLTGNPLTRHIRELRLLASHTTRELKERVEGKVTVGGLVTRLRRTKIKSGPNQGRVMGHFVLEDLEGAIAVTLFADHLQRYESLLAEEAVVVVKGSLRERGADCELMAEEIVPLERASSRLVSGLEVHLDPGLATAQLLRVRDLLAEHPGELPVSFALDLPEGGTVRIEPEERFRVGAESELLVALEAIVGPGRARHLRVVDAA